MKHNIETFNIELKLCSIKDFQLVVVEWNIWRERGGNGVKLYNLGKDWR